MGTVFRKLKAGRDLGWYIAFVDSDGKRRHRATHQPTQKLARAMLGEIEARIRRGLIGVPEPRPDPQSEAASPTVGDLCERWLAELANPRIKDPKSYRADAQTGLRRILPHLGSRKLALLTRGDIEAARDAVARRWPSPNTLRSTLRPLGAALTWAVQKGLLAQNPARGIALPRAEGSLEYLDAPAARRLLTVAEQQARETDDLRPYSRWVALALALHLGLRRGEIFGLRWQDLDIDSGRLTVARSYGGSPKSGQARHLRLPSVLVTLLRQWRPRCVTTPAGLVCPVARGTAWGMSGQSTSHGLKELLQAAQCPPLRRGWHALRHTFASQFVMSGGNILTLQKILGHSDIKMTLVYAHLAPDFLAAEVERVRY